MPIDTLTRNAVNFRYHDAPRCERCHGRVVMPAAVADWFVEQSDGRLDKLHCPAGRGWHVRCPEVVARRQSRG